MRINYRRKRSTVREGRDRSGSSLKIIGTEPAGRQQFPGWKFPAATEEVLCAQHQWWPPRDFSRLGCRGREDTSQGTCTLSWRGTPPTWHWHPGVTVLSWNPQQRLGILPGGCSQQRCQAPHTFSTAAGRGTHT